MLLSGSHMSKQGYLTQCMQCFVCSQNYQVCSTRKYCKEGFHHNGQNPNIQIQDLQCIHIKFLISLSVLHPRVHLRHHRQPERHDAQPRRGINEENIVFFNHLLKPRWLTLRCRTLICFAGIMGSSRFFPICLSRMWLARWWMSSWSCQRCWEHFYISSMVSV